MGGGRGAGNEAIITTIIIIITVRGENGEMSFEYSDRLEEDVVDCDILVVCISVLHSFTFFCLILYTPLSQLVYFVASI